MSELCVQKKRRYHAQIPHEVLEDRNLSWKAVGILSYLLSKPNNWIVRVGDLKARHGDGERSVQSGLKELETAGYLYRFRVHINGRLDWRSIVFDEPASESEAKQAEEDYVARLQEAGNQIVSINAKRSHRNSIPTKQRHCNNGVETATDRVKPYKKEKQVKNESEPPAQISPASPIAPLGALGSGEEPKQPDQIVGITFPGLGKIARNSLHPRFVELFENDTHPDIDEDIDYPGESMFLDEEIDEWCYLLPYGKRRPAPRQVQVTTPAVETVDRNDEGLQNRLRAQIKEILDRAAPVRDEQQLYPGQYAMIGDEWREATEEDCYG